jgi:hypothetical protein
MSTNLPPSPTTGSPPKLTKRLRKNGILEEPSHVKQFPPNHVCKIGLSSALLLKKGGETECREGRYLLCRLISLGVFSSDTKIEKSCSTRIQIKHSCGSKEYFKLKEKYDEVLHIWPSG